MSQRFPRVPSTSQGRREPETGTDLHAEVTLGRMTPSGRRVSAEVRRLRFGNALCFLSKRNVETFAVSISLSHTFPPVCPPPPQTSALSLLLFLYYPSPPFLSHPPLIPGLHTEPSQADGLER